MSFLPIFPVWAMLVIAGILIVVRMLTLYRVLVRTGRGRYRGVVLRWSGLTMAVLLLMLAAARPALVPEPPQDEPPRIAQTSENLNVFFVVDRSVNQRVLDFGAGQSRMSGARDDILALVSQYPRARFAVIGFSSKAHMDWPLSDDAWSLRPFVAGMSPYTDVPLDASTKVDTGAAAELLNTKIGEARTQFPGSKTLVYYFGSGAPGSRVEQGRFALDDGALAGGAVLGYGTSKGGPIPLRYQNGTLLFMTDQQTGAPLNSTLNEGALNAVATQLGVRSFTREANQPITSVMPTVEPGVAADSAPLIASKIFDRTELYWLFTMLAAALVLVEMYLTIRDIRRTRTARRDVRL